LQLKILILFFSIQSNFSYMRSKGPKKIRINKKFLQEVRLYMNFWAKNSCWKIHDANFCIGKFAVQSFCIWKFMVQNFGGEKNKTNFDHNEDFTLKIPYSNFLMQTHTLRKNPCKIFQSQKSPTNLLFYKSSTHKKFFLKTHRCYIRFLEWTQFCVSATTVTCATTSSQILWMALFWRTDITLSVKFFQM
jgi:hypothetical protein